MESIYDIIIIGAGPGGTVTAAHAGRLGQKVLLIEKEQLGGVCLNAGCIPTKTLLHSAKQYVHAKEAPSFGVSTGEVRFDLSKAMSWKSEVVETLRAGISFTMKKNGVEVIHGPAKFIGSQEVQVGENLYTGENIIIATGSAPLIPPIPGVDQPQVMTSTEILTIQKMPTTLTIVGGGAIGIEFASFFSHLGVQVEILERLDEILPFMDRIQAKALRRAFRGKVKFNLGCNVTAIAEDSVKYTDAQGAEQSHPAELVLLSVGRSPNLAGMGLEEVGIAFDDRGIQVDGQQRTNVPGIYAIGDVTGLSQLAHSASRMGEVALHTIGGQPDHFSRDAIPWVVYSMPEAAGCGWTEEEARKAGYSAEAASLPLTMSGRFMAENGKRGVGSVTVVKDTDTDLLLGVHMVGAGCSEIIYGAAVMLESKLPVRDIRNIVFPHPTVGEVLRDVMFEWDGSGEGRGAPRR